MAATQISQTTNWPYCIQTLVKPAHKVTLKAQTNLEDFPTLTAQTFWLQLNPVYLHQMSPQ